MRRKGRFGVNLEMGRLELDIKGYVVLGSERLDM
jgi:hypothetical protein